MNRIIILNILWIFKYILLSQDIEHFFLLFYFIYLKLIKILRNSADVIKKILAVKIKTKDSNRRKFYNSILGEEKTVIITKESQKQQTILLVGFNSFCPNCYNLSWIRIILSFGYIKVKWIIYCVYN